jgi:hypothetical protein
VPTGATLMRTPSTGAVPITCHQYDVCLTLLHPNGPVNLGAAPVVECLPLGGNIDALLGRDGLSLCLFIYDGPAQQFSLGF